ncbi:HypC/HybG/HupF family hydrogenase formation chaperone [Patescibacteria group bacterium]|nr:HypC/HybG/HupF family hydrogenase formation chaperone [Patescibacteria group bacterium]MBU1673079.1 HypC/HybG/HupF family hydrogenase formation chaperone [Patescibacteria group bacterium]MBU1963685.1 HypC/HybG/HupF family hydrogenase formation chaperone [Patescibacteria group bacterium]
MCLSIPGKISSISGKGIIVDYKTKKATIFNSLVEDIKEGDWVLVENKFITRKLSDAQAKEFFNLIKE